MYESALERQIKPCKRRKISDSGIFIIQWNITFSMKRLIYITVYTIKLRNEFYISYE